METVTIAYEREHGKIIAVLFDENPDFLQILAGDQSFLRDHQLTDVSGLGLITPQIETAGFSASDYYVHDDTLVQLRRISLTTSATDSHNPNGVPEIAGDGVSSCTITATVFDQHGAVDQQFNRPIRFSAARGKLAARNGIITAEAGVATTTLTSVAETVAPFDVRAEAAGCAPGTLKLEFY